MKVENSKGKIADICRKIGKKNMIIACAFVLVAVALVIAV